MDFSEFLQSGIIGVFGKPGAGKSYFATRVVLKEIKGENRPIVTNVPINKDDVEKLTGKQSYIYQLETFTNNKYFFTQRGDYTIDLPDTVTDEALDFQKYLKEHDEGVLYIIDEAGLYFNSRNWRYMQGSTLSYFTFIRHVGDTCLWLSQSYGDVDKQIRGKTQTFNLIRNMSKERLGWFKRGNGFHCYQYVTEQDIDSQMKNPQQEFSYGFDKKVAKCYQTSLFNKTRDKNYKVKGVSLKYMIGAVVVAVLCFLTWIATGGITDLSKSVFSGALIQKEEVVETVNAQVGPQKILPAPDPFEEVEQVPMIDYEYPSLTFPNFAKLGPFGTIEEKTKDKLDAYFFGTRRYCTLTFVSETNNIEKEKDFSFSAILEEFASVNPVAVGFGGNRFELATSVFQGALKWVNENGSGKSIKTVKVIVKENVPFHLKQGFEIPMQKSVAVQGAIQTNIEYKQIGFDLILVMESTELGELLAVEVSNNEVLDLSAPVPVLASFENRNVLQVKDGMTYEIADFNSMEENQSRGIFKKRELRRSLRNHVYISYGN